MKSIWPEISDDELAQIVLMDAPKTPSKPKCAETEHGRDALDESDFKEIQKLCAGFTDDKATRQRWLDGVMPGSKYMEDLKAVSSKTIKKPSAAAVAKAKAIDFKKLKRVDEVKKTLPKVLGCTIQHVKWKRCWTAFYPGVFPGSRTRTYGACVTQASVIKHVVHWSHRMHEKATGTPSPF